MTRRERLQVLYSRTLRWGIGVSILFHAGVLAFGHLNVGPVPADEQTAQRSLAQVLPRPNDTAIRLIDLSAASRSESAQPNEVNGATPGDIKVTTEKVPAPPSFSEAAMILAKLDIMAEPVVPQPQMVPETVDSGLTPIRVVSSGAIVFASRPARRRGGGIRIRIGTGDCPAGPTGILPALINDQVPHYGGFRGTR